MRIAVLQMTSGIDPEANFQTIVNALEKARAGGATMMFTPEMSLLLDRDRARADRHILTEEDSPYPRRLEKLAADMGMWLTVGAPVRLTGDDGEADGDGRFANRQWVFGPSQENCAHYDKIHMFDVELENGESWRESKAFRPGEDAVVLDDTPVGRLGLTICYDMRFPALFDMLGRAACDCIAVPAAFTVPTGKAHWHTLLRARAIEASAYVIAPAQVGDHEDGRSTFGHSLVVDPWGDIVLDMGAPPYENAPGLGFAEIDTSRIAAVRNQIPSLANKRPITGPKT